jgi:hypothetical protein
MAPTVKLWVVLGKRPPTVWLVPAVWAAWVPLRKTRYWTAQFSPGATAFQARVTDVSVFEGALSPVGTLGSVLQPAGPLVVTERGALCAEALPALSRARTVNEYVVLGLRPVTVKLGPVGEPARLPPR